MTNCCTGHLVEAVDNKLKEVHGTIGVTVERIDAESTVKCEYCNSVSSYHTLIRK